MNFGTVLRKSDCTFFFGMFTSGIRNIDTHEALKQVIPRKDGEQSPSLGLETELDKPLLS